MLLNEPFAESKKAEDSEEERLSSVSQATNAAAIPSSKKINFVRFINLAFNEPLSSCPYLPFPAKLL